MVVLGGGVKRMLIDGDDRWIWRFWRDESAWVRDPEQPGPLPCSTDHHCSKVPLSEEGPRAVVGNSVQGWKETAMGATEPEAVVPSCWRTKRLRTGMRSETAGCNSLIDLQGSRPLSNALSTDCGRSVGEHVQPLRKGECERGRTGNPFFLGAYTSDVLS